MSKPPFKVAVVSDIHLGHRRNDTQYIIANLDKAFPDDSETAELDMIIVAGDVFDRSLMLRDGDAYFIDAWIVRLLRLCAKHDIKLRVLGGTHSHDWDQSERFPHLNKVANIHADLKYFPDLAIDYEPDHDIHILYVPDELNDDPNKTLDQVKELMKSKGLSKVDYAAMHGQFEYQLPPVVKAPKHDSDAYLAIVDKLIFIGHVHVFTRKSRIIAQGSFDRLTHGEEAPKGHVRAEVYSADKYYVTFVENEGARKFLTVECQGLTLDETLREIAEFVKGVPDLSFVRVSCSPSNPILAEMDQLVRMWPMITWSKIVREEQFQSTDEAAAQEVTQEYIPIQITRDNIEQLVMDKMRSKIQDPELLEIAQRLLDEIR